MSDVSPPPRIGVRDWYKSRASSGNCACVEVRFNFGGTVSIRDSKYRIEAANDPKLEPIATVSSGVWSDFLGVVAERASSNVESTLVADHNADGTTTIRSIEDGVELHYTADEWTAFLAGVHAGEFDLEPATA